MRKLKMLGIMTLGVSAFFITACSKNNDTPAGDGNKESVYVLMTLADRVSGSKGGFVSSYEEFPNGEISNVNSGSLEGQGMGGWRTYENMIFKMYSTSSYSGGIEKLNVNKNGTVSVDKFLASKNPVIAEKFNGTGNLVIENSNSGYYWDAAEPLKVQKFNPTLMTNTGSIDLSEAVNERGEGDDKIKFRSVGQKFLAIKGGKLFVNLTYTANNQNQVGFFDDYYPDVYIAVIDLSTEKYEKTIKIKETGSIAYINENHMYDFDTNGDLYIVTQGRNALGTDSKISRIKADETEIDPSWELKFSDFDPSDNGKFANVFAKNQRLIFTLNTVPLTGGKDGNINSDDIWEFYSLDVSDDSKRFNKIEGVPVGTNPGAAMVAVEVDNKVLLRGSTKGKENGYYEYDFDSNTAKRSFSVNVGGSISGFVKIKLD